MLKTVNIDYSLILQLEVIRLCKTHTLCNNYLQNVNRVLYLFLRYDIIKSVKKLGLID